MWLDVTQALKSSHRLRQPWLISNNRWRHSLGGLGLYEMRSRDTGVARVTGCRISESKHFHTFINVSNVSLNNKYRHDFLKIYTQTINVYILKKKTFLSWCFYFNVYFDDKLVETICLQQDACGEFSRHVKTHTSPSVKMSPKHVSISCCLWQPGVGRPHLHITYLNICLWKSLKWGVGAPKSWNNACDRGHYYHWMQVGAIRKKSTGYYLNQWRPVSMKHIHPVLMSSSGIGHLQTTYIHSYLRKSTKSP